MTDVTTDSDLLHRIDAVTRNLERDPGAGLITARELYAAATGGGQQVKAAAAYTLGRALALTGEPSAARPLVEEAATRWEAAGEVLQALRTRAGLMQLLTSAGAHHAAIDHGRRALEELARCDPNGAEGEIAGILHQNLGVAAAHGGAFDEALTAYDRAEQAFRSGGCVDRLPALAANRAAELLDLGRVDDATTLLHAARSAASGDGTEVVAARCGAMLGWALALRGDVDQGILELQHAETRFEELDMLADRDLAAVRIGEAHLLISDWAGAMSHFDRILGRDTASSHAQTWCGANLGAAAAHLGADNLDDADRCLRVALDGWWALDHVPGMVATLVELAGLSIRRGGRDEALDLAWEASRLLGGQDTDSRWPIHRLYCDLRLVDALLPDHEAAEPIAIAAVERAAIIGIPLLRCRAVRRLATVRLAQGSIGEAVTLLYETLAIGEFLRSRLPREVQRLSFGDEVDAALVALIDIRLDAGTRSAVTEAAQLADRRRDRVLSELVDGSLRPDELRFSADTLDLRTTLTVASDALLDEGSPARADALRQHVTQLATRLREVAATHPEPQPESVTPGRAGTPHGPAARRLTTIAYTQLGDEIAAVVTGGDSVRAVRSLTDRATLQELLEDLDGELWGGGLHHRSSRHQDAVVRSSERLLGRFGTALIDPIRHLLPLDDPIAQLAIVPHGILHDVPFHALISRGELLLDLVATTISPNTTFTTLLPQTGGSTGTGPRVTALGVPTTRTPGIADELAAFPANGFDTTVLVGRDATIEALRGSAGDGDILHLACHGQFDGDQPSRSGLRLADGWLSAADISRLDLTGSMVVLSACDSARLGYRGPGAQTLGISRAFLAAGARSVIASRWLLDDAHAATTISAFARHLVADPDPAAALRRAQLEQRQHTPHPVHWAPFAALGHPHIPKGSTC